MSYDKNNIFAKILKGEIPCKKVYENEHVLAFYDVNPQKKTHVLVIPKGEYIDLDDFSSGYKGFNSSDIGLDVSDGVFSSEDYDFISKTDIIKKIRETLIEKIVIIGDRIHDINAGYENDIVTLLNNN